MRLFVGVLALCSITAACGGKGNPHEPSSSTGPSALSSAGPASPTAPAADGSGNSQTEVEGLVESLPPTTAALTFKVAGRTVVTNASTVFKDGSVTRGFADLKIGMRVEAKGTASSDAITASVVEMQNERVDAPVEVNGVIDSLSGNAAAFQFEIGSHLVKGDTATTFFGNGDKPGAFADLKNGLRVEVKGQQGDGFVQAVRVHIEDDNDDDDEPPQPPQDPEVEITGTLRSMGGAAPTLTLTVNTTTVHTSNATAVKRRGDTLTLAALQVGQTLEIEGTRRTDGSIDARKITIEDEDENEEDEVEFEGSLSGLAGSCPALRFIVGSRSVATSASTEFDKTACGAFRNGDRVQVKGNQQSNGSVIATRLRKKN